MRPHPRKKEPCPCGSGRQFRSCCDGQALRWVRDNEGNWSKSIPLSPEALSVFEEQFQEFESYFGRKPADDDMVFMAAYMITDDRMNDVTVRAMRAASIDEAKIFAYQKTGLIVTEHNQDLLTGRDLDEWNAAFKEFETLKRENRLEEPLSPLAELLAEVLVEFRRCTTVMGFVLGEGGEYVSEVPPELGMLHAFCFFCFSKSLKALRAIELLVNDGFGEDAMAIARSVYESYIHVRYVLDSPDKINDLVLARLGIKQGTHEYRKTKKGRNDYRVIVEIATGREYDGKISTRTMAEASRFEEDLEIHEHLYEFLSSYTHPDFSILEHYLDENHFDHRLENISFEPVSLGLIFGGLLLDAVADPPLLGGQLVSDVRFYLGNFKSVTEKLLNELASANPTNGLPSVLQGRIRRIVSHSSNQRTGTKRIQT